MDKIDATPSTLVHDEVCLENMRQIVKKYIVYRQQHPTEEDTCRAFRTLYEEQRQNMRNDALKSFTPFELMEKLYWQEYLING